jgi:hypothetical protein
MKLTALAGFALMILSGLLFHLMTRPWRDPFTIELRRKYVTLPASPVQEGVPAPPRFETGQVEPEANTDPVETRVDLKALRRAMHSGDHYELGWIKGRISPDQAASLYDLISEIPEATTEGDRRQVIDKFIHLLCRSPGDEISRLMLWMAAREEKLTFLNWLNIAHELVDRRFPEAVPYLESVAFGAGGASRYGVGTAASLLVKLDTDRYLPVVLRAVRDPDEKVSQSYLGALTPAARTAHPDVGSLVPVLMEKCTNAPPDSVFRFTLLNVVGTYSVSSRSDELRSWTLAELKKRELKAEAGSTESIIDDLYRDLIRQLEGKEE